MDKHPISERDRSIEAKRLRDAWLNEVEKRARSWTKDALTEQPILPNQWRSTLP